MNELSESGILLATMPAVQRSEFALALNQVATERGVDISVVLDTVKNAILAAYRKDHPGIEIEEFNATLDQSTGEAKIFHKEEDVTPPGFGRIAAQTAKQVILQKIREKEKEAILSDYEVKIGTIANGMVLRFAGPNIIVDIGKAEGIMPPNEQIQNEKYHLNQRLTIFLSEIKEGLKGKEIVVSRSAPGLLEGLFKREVPEVAQGSVQIKGIAREAGSRSKIAVASTQSGIDPVGSCVGQKGVRVQAIIQEFNGIEKLDIIQWVEDQRNFIGQALSPAKDLRVEIDAENKIAHVFVAKEELSLAIGKEGQNVRLASKLTGYRIEIEEKIDKEALAKAAQEEEDSAKQKKEELAAQAKEKKAAASKKKSKKKVEEVEEVEVEEIEKTEPEVSAAEPETSEPEAAAETPAETVELTPETPKEESVKNEE